MQKFRFLLFLLKESYICYYIICVTVPLMKAFKESQFNYFLLIWMHHSRALGNKNNFLHERTLKTVYSDYKSSFNQLFDKDGCFMIHQRNDFDSCDLLIRRDLYIFYSNK